jgi:NAD(P)-dependent dehydrogenase (short-subunit alcohol dehydrogenase family)
MLVSLHSSSPRLRTTRSHHNPVASRGKQAPAPGLIRTPMTAKRTEDPQKMADELPHIPWDRPSEPWKVARLALYLASDDADYADAGVELVGLARSMYWASAARLAAIPAGESPANRGVQSLL